MLRRAIVVATVFVLLAAACGSRSSRDAVSAGSAPGLPTTPTAYWRGWDIARSVALTPGGNSGYVLDAFGGVHTFGLRGHQAAPTPLGLPYWRGWDIARSIAMLPDGTGFVLDGWGGLQPFAIPGHQAPARPTAAPSWRGWSIARGLALLPGGTGGYVLDGFGGLHPFGLGANAAPPRPVGAPYWKGWDIARAVVLRADGTGGYVLDGFGGLHPFALPGHQPPAAPAHLPYWRGWDIARSVALFGDGSGYVLDGYGGFHGFRPPAAAGVPSVPPSTGVVRAAFYYPWFPGGWNQHGIDPYTNFHPSLGSYDGTQPSVVAAQIAAMQYGHISAGIASWWGAGSDTDRHIPTLLQAAAGTGFKWSLYYENESTGDPSVATIRADLTYMRDHYWSSPSYLHIDGKPVVFVYTDGADGCAMAQRWKDADTLGAYVVLKVFAGFESCAAQPQSWHQYGPADAVQDQAPWSYTVSPGFWKVGEPARLGRDVSRFAQGVAAMAASGAQLQLVTTFNEWGEGTAVESASEWASASGYGAYLDVLHSVPVAPLSGGGATTTTTPTTTPTTTTVPGGGASPCGTALSAPAHYKHVIWVWMENKSWSDVIGKSAAPYETALANACGTATSWGDAGSQFSSEPSYIGATSGLVGSALNPFAGHAAPSATVSTTADNLFRQVRAAGGNERSYEEGMNANCSNSGTRYAPKHNPSAYFWAPADRAACAVDDIPMGSVTSGAFVDALRNDALPTFSFVTPNLCNDTHDCPVATGDTFLRQLVPQVIASPSYQRGDTALFVVWDEDTPIPNIVVAPSVHPGTVVTSPVNHYSLLRATEEMLGMPLLGAAGSAPSLRPLFRI